MSRSQSFGAAAADYHRFRPGYPAELADVVLAHATGSVRTALEIGAGTGKATRLFAERGVHVTAVEPDAGMRAVLEADTHALPVAVLPSTFEAVDLSALGPVDLVFAAASFHWTDPATRWQRVTAALRPGGVVAVFGAQTVLADAALADAVTAIETEINGSLADLVSPYVEPVDIADLQAVELTILPRRSEHDADHYVSHLATTSAYLVLEPAARASVLSRVRDLLPDRVEVVQDVYLQLARRA